jgi:hypothetical protein
VRGTRGLTHTSASGGNISQVGPVWNIIYQQLSHGANPNRFPFGIHSRYTYGIASITCHHLSMVALQVINESGIGPIMPTVSSRGSICFAEVSMPSARTQQGARMTYTVGGTTKCLMISTTSLYGTFQYFSDSLDSSY